MKALRQACAWGLLALAALGAPGRAAETPLEAAALRHTSRTLPNGLRVFSILDRSSPNVSVQVWYDVGSKNDPAGRSGFAHLFEHLMFKATRNMAPEEIDRLTEDVGGFANATTHDDYTSYFEVVPANHLERLLWAEAERMGALAIGPDDLASEREVVKEELRSTLLAEPYGKLFHLYLPQVSYAAHPYARPRIGSLEDLDAATLKDVRAFHATYYRPDNAVLVVAGNFDQAQLDGWVDRYFAPIEQPERPIPRVTAVEPARTAAKTYTVHEPNTPLPAVLMSFRAPPASSRDSAALAVLDAILALGESSRLHRALVYRDAVAMEAGTVLDEKQAPGAYAVYAIVSSGQSVADGGAALAREVARLREAPVTTAELARAKDQLLTEALRSRETVEGKATELALAIILHGDPKAADAQLEAIAAVTAADVQRVARAYLGDHQRAVVRYLPKDAQPAGVAGDAIATPPTVRAAALAAPDNIRAVTPAAASERVAAPPAAAPVAVAVPEPAERRLANGLRVAVVERRGLPLVTAMLATGGGAALDPPGRAGLAELTAALITEGTATRSATDVADGVEALGGSLSSGAGWDGSILSLTVMSDRLGPGLALFQDVALRPAFAAEEVERQRTLAIDGVAIELADPGTLAVLVADRAVFGAGPYGHVRSGTPASLAAITRDDVTAAYRAAWRPDNATLIFVGDVGAAQGFALAERLFGGWTAPPARPAAPAGAAPARSRAIVVDMPDAEQAAVVVARPALARRDPTYHAALVANATLGAGFSSRLGQEIRIKRGLAYHVDSTIEARRGVGPLVVSTRTKSPSAPEVLELIVAEMRRLGAEPVPAAELATRKTALAGDFGRQIETTEGLATLLGELAMAAAPLSEFVSYLPGIEAATSQEVRSAAKSVLDPAAASVVIVGDAGQFADRLRAGHAGVEIIPAASLDLDDASLH